MNKQEYIDTHKQDVITDENWPLVEKAFDACLEQVNEYRRKEGEVLYRDVTGRVHAIESLYNEVEAFIPEMLHVHFLMMRKARES